MSDSSIIKTRHEMHSKHVKAKPTGPRVRPELLAKMPDSFLTSPGMILGIVVMEFLYGLVLFAAMSGRKREQPEDAFDTETLVMTKAAGPSAIPKAEASPTAASPAPESTAPPPRSDQKPPKKDDRPPDEPARVAEKSDTRPAPAPALTEPTTAPPAPTQVAVLTPSPATTRETKKEEPKKVEPKRDEKVGLGPLGPLIDPDHDCDVVRDPQGVTIMIPGKFHALSLEPMKITNAPRALMEVTGDFDVQVMIPGDIRPGTNMLKNFPFTFQGAGLLLWVDENNYVRLDRGEMYSGEAGRFHHVMVENIKGGKPGRPTPPVKINDPRPHDANPNEPKPAGGASRISLAMVRHGEELSCWYSSDLGKTWLPVKRWAAGLPHKVQIGISATNAAAKTFPARFEEFTQTKGTGTGKPRTSG